MEENASIATGSIDDLARDFLIESDETAREYLRQGWLSEATAALRNARRQATLTQEELAQKLGTTQSAVARLENDQDGRISLHRFIDYALACGAIPLDVELEPFAKVRRYAIENPSDRRTQLAYDQWLRAQTEANARILSSVGGAVTISASCVRTGALQGTGSSEPSTTGVRIAAYRSSLLASQLTNQLPVDFSVSLSGGIGYSGGFPNQEEKEQLEVAA